MKISGVNVAVFVVWANNRSDSDIPTTRHDAMQTNRVSERFFTEAYLATATNGEIGRWSAGLRPGVSGSGSCKGAGPEAGAPVAVSRCALFTRAQKNQETIFQRAGSLIDYSLTRQT